METHQLFPGQNQARVCLVQPKTVKGLIDPLKNLEIALARSAKQISESLGAQINPDLSWTSSFNTPSSLTPTVILPKTEERAPSSGIKDKEAISEEGYGFQTASGKGVSISAGALKKAKAIFKDCDENIDLESAKMEGTYGKLDVELKQPSSVQQPPQEELCEEKDLQSEFSKLPSELLPPNGNCAFSTASGRKVSVSAGALQRAKDLLLGSVDGFSCADGSPKTKQVLDIQMDTSSIRKHKGFSTAGGKMVAVSAAGLQKAKNLFRDCEEESLSSEDLQHQCFSDLSKKPLTKVRAASAGCSDVSFSHEHETGNSSGKNTGFSTAGGKKVTFSATALQRAKSLFKDCEEESFDSGSLQHQGCKGFSTASGKEVTISEKALSEVRATFAGYDDTSLHHGPENSSGNNIGFSTAGGKKVAVSITALQRAESLFKDCEEENLSSKEVLPQAKSSESSEDTVDGNLNCTDTQQKYFEQEAMACTKALLADDDLNESASLAMTEDKKSPFVHLQAQGSFALNRKRPFDARNVAGQPPLKRQLLSEFDQTLDAKTSGLTPLKTCPNGTLRDRRVFSYNVHLKPNVTGPDW
ncbi:hypothetical protein cypCar_00039196 [Cyprinus carpio]|nr:hypothetical protein cypCar_00039196 [Cyprinus carpio]